MVEKAAREQAPQADGPPRIAIKGFDIGGSITVIGPGVVTHTRKIGEVGGDAPDLQRILGKALEAAGAELPDDVAEKSGDE